uniref:Uncharacterized protein n=1 Tax=Arundo donax TaxID=35708 RepID=A0A0A8YDM7_ARUDO
MCAEIIHCSYPAVTARRKTYCLSGNPA